jgi:hypothetical protein
MAVPPEVASIITRKKAQYGRFADLKQWEKFDQISLPETSFNFYDTNGTPLQVGKTALVFPNRKLFINFFEPFFRNLQTQHIFGPPDLEMIKKGEVRAIWALEDQLIMKGTAGLVELRGGGFYTETWVSRDGDWFIKQLDMTRTYTKTSFAATILFLLVSLLGLLGLNLV